jgi:hypothetical protein
MVSVSTQTRPISIMVTIKSIIVMLANAMASTFTDADAVGTDRHGRYSFNGLVVECKCRIVTLGVTSPQCSFGE